MSYRPIFKYSLDNLSTADKRLIKKAALYVFEQVDFFEISSEDLAKSCRISLKRLREIQKGELPDPDELERLTDRFGISSEDLEKFCGGMNSKNDDSVDCLLAKIKAILVASNNASKDEANEKFGGGQVVRRLLKIKGPCSGHWKIELIIEEKSREERDKSWKVIRNYPAGYNDFYPPLKDGLQEMLGYLDPLRIKKEKLVEMSNDKGSSVEDLLTDIMSILVQENKGELSGSRWLQIKGPYFDSIPKSDRWAVSIESERKADRPVSAGHRGYPPLKDGLQELLEYLDEK